MFQRKVSREFYAPFVIYASFGQHIVQRLSLFRIYMYLQTSVNSAHNILFLQSNSMNTLQLVLVFFQSTYTLICQSTIT